MYRNTRLKRTTHLLITNLVVSDLLVPIFVGPTKLYEIHKGRYAWLVEGPLGSMLCKLVPFCADVSAAVSIQSYVVISLDRFIAVVFHTRKPLLKSKTCRYLMLLLWITAALFHSPYFYTYRITTLQKQTLCYSSWQPAFKNNLQVQSGYILAAFTLLFGLPLMAIAFFYTAVAYVLRNRVELVREDDIRRQRRRKENRRVNRMLIAVVLLFIICYSPGMVFGFVSLYASAVLVPNNCTGETLRVSVLIVAHSNCAVNPLIFFLFNKSYRKGLRKLCTINNCKF